MRRNSQADDVKKKEEVEVINQADNLIYATEKSLKDYGDKVSQAERADIEAKANDLKTTIKDKNINRIKIGMEALSKASHKLAEEVYKQAASKQQQQGQASGFNQDLQIRNRKTRIPQKKKISSMLNLRKRKYTILRRYNKEVCRGKGNR